MPPLPSFSIPRSMEINVKESEQHLEKELCTKYTKRCYMDSKFKHMSHGGKPKQKISCFDSKFSDMSNKN